MKVSAKQYARLLWNCLEEQGESKKKEVIKSFVQTLFRRRQLRLEYKIIEALKNIEKQEKGLARAKVRSAYEMSDQEKKNVADFVKEKLNCKEVKTNFQTDKNLIGGVEFQIFDVSTNLSNGLVN